MHRLLLRASFTYRNCPLNSHHSLWQPVEACSISPSYQQNATKAKSATNGSQEWKQTAKNNTKKVYSIYLNYKETLMGKGTHLAELSFFISLFPFRLHLNQYLSSNINSNIEQQSVAVYSFTFCFSK